MGRPCGCGQIDWCAGRMLSFCSCLSQHLEEFQLARKVRSRPRKPGSTGTRSKRSPERAGDALPSKDEIMEAFRRASPAQRALLIAGGLVVLGTSPYWGPAVWRSKRVRDVLAAGAGIAFDRFLG